MKKFSVIIPVFNRPNEMKELLDSLAVQSCKDFELVVVEDGSSIKSDVLIKDYESLIDIHYYYKPNSGPGESRNYGMERAKGEYLVFFDSDCIIPPNYFETVSNYLKTNPLDCYGGPDSAHESFSDVQKAINFAMTSFLTTGGIRGKKSNLDKFQPRSFNMGIKRSVYEKIGGFSDIHPGEDPDLSYRIMNGGFKTGLIENAYVYHKRRIDFSKYIKQVYKFGVVRPILMKWYPDKTKLVYFFPTLFLLFSIAALLNVVFFSKLIGLFFVILTSVLFVSAFMQNKKLKIALVAVFASFVQLYGYGYGFFKSYVLIKILNKNEREVFPDFFFKK